MIDFLAEARAASGELAALRRAFHSCPELGNHEFKTAARIEEELAALGIPFRRMLDTAVVARLEGALPGPTVALRADMDALPMAEATGVDYASRNPGVMHACGHDVHMAAALGAAKLLAARRDQLRGAVVFLFQPDEEGDGGAQRMIASGALEGVDAVFGAHVSPELPAGSVGVRYGKFYAASDVLYGTVLGRSAHGAEREKGVDALGAAAQMAVELIGLPKRLAGERTVVSIGKLNAGTAGNALAERADFLGIMRSLGPEARRRLKEMCLEVAERVEAEWGAKVELKIKESYPGVVNHDDMTALVERAARELLGDGCVRVIDAPTMTTEDFGYFLMERPGAYYHIGVGGDKPLHNTAFLPDERAIAVAAAVHAAVVWKYSGRVESEERPS